MNLQYITDNRGNNTGVFIPIQDWDNLVKKYTVLKNEVESTIPDWHKDVINKRLSDYKNNPETAMDFETVMDEIEKEL